MAFAEDGIANNTSIRRYSVLWDGTIATITELVTLSQGSIVASVVDNAGVLSARVFSSVAASDVKLSCSISGSLFVANFNTF